MRLLCNVMAAVFRVANIQLAIRFRGLGMFTFAAMPIHLSLYEMNLLDHIVAGVICIVAPIMAYTSRRIIAEDIRLETEDKIRLYHSNGLLLFVFALVVVTLWRIPGRTLAGIGFTWPDWNGIVILLLFAIFVLYGLDLFLQYGTRKWRERSLSRKHGALSFIPANRQELLHFGFLALAAGIGEEVIFRGFLIHYFVYWTGNSTAGIIAACLFSTALFAFLHGYQGTLSMIKIFFLALIFSAIFIFSQSLLIVIVVHTVIDIMSGWFGIHLLRYIREKEESNE
jgi:membrane protease YdiL (CAAX protease family)